MKKINTFLITFTIYFLIIYILSDIDNLTFSTLLLIPLISGIKILRKLLKLKINDSTEFIYIIFIIGSHLFGRTFNLYDTLMNYDKLIHFLSGILSSVFALVILNNSRLKNRTEITDIVFIITVALSVASIWECFEYIADLLLNKDLQNVIKTGINDTMQDIICALLSSIIFSIIYYIKYKKLVKN